MNHPTKAERVAAANATLAVFAREVRIHIEHVDVYVTWPNYSSQSRTKRKWKVHKDNSTLPIWYQKYPGGATSRNAMAMLVRWVRGESVRSIHSWRMMVEHGRLLSHSAVDKLQAAGYPEKVDCVHCLQPLEGSEDWWSYDGIVGPCCYQAPDGCRTP